MATFWERAVHSVYRLISLYYVYLLFLVVSYFGITFASVVQIAPVLGHCLRNRSALAVNCCVIIYCLSVSCTKINHSRCALVILSSLQLTKGEGRKKGMLLKL